MSAKKSSHNAPNRGDAVWLELTPTAGHEQSGRRSALVLSLQEFNARRCLALICPVTKNPPRSLFEIEIPEKSVVAGTILADQVRMVDFNARDWQHIGVLPTSVVRQALDIVAALIA